VSKRAQHNGWKAWGEYRKERSRLKDFRNYKQEALEDRMMHQVYIIVNEWTDVANQDGSEITGGKFYETEDAAWDDLSVIADENYGVDLKPDETSFVIEDPTNGLQYEEYRIEVLSNGEAR
jgi:hypothetical protein